MADYKAVYKCRLCENLFSANKMYTQDQMLEKMAESNIISVIKPSSRHYEIHLCKDESCGIADLQGFRKVSDSL